MDSAESQVQQQNSSKLEHSSFPFGSPANKYTHEDPPRSTPMVTMISGDMTTKTEATMSPGIWQTPISAIRPRPATIHEGFSSCCSSEEYGSLPAWDSSTLSLQQTPSDTMCSSRPVSMHQEFFTPVTSDCGSWAARKGDEGFEFQDMQIGQAYTADEAIPILDLRFQNQQNEDFSSALSEAPSLSSDYPPPSNRTSLLSSCTQLSPVASPRLGPSGRNELVRTQSRGHASPSPRPGARSAPYSVDANRNKRWSTGSYGTQQRNRAASYNMYHTPPEMFGPRIPGRQDSPALGNTMPLSYSNLQAAQQNPYMVTGAPFRNSMLLPTQLPSHGYPADMHTFQAPPPLMSHGLFRMLQSNGDPYAMHAHYGDLSDPPDLYSALHEEQIPPPPEDMNPSDPDLVPHEQELRFEGDLYTPRWVRGHGNKREGWCGICKPGRWLVLKNSAYWYDKSFTHGISATTGSPFQEPLETRRMDGNPDVWEGLCGSCNDWVALVSSKKKGTTWFRHAYKCHTHPKIKDAPKRRRESNQNRGLAASTMAKPKLDPQAPLTPPSQMTHAGAVSMAEPTPPVPMIPAHMLTPVTTHQQTPTSVPPPRPLSQYSHVLPPPTEGAPPGMI
ncbi:hypothetical protein TD95_003652 [Thielaviopsis punctulata]|uniref:Transcription regulator Rua1 C-terminal domain-containing protein n=1 Tax=Thielaviopsis punctulata TaxID=72032 RepID=A0A0F4ZBY8_9PEZI|nr:hypothetical protein TD95_003652 [Thielaviopsis punctulata]